MPVTSRAGSETETETETIDDWETDDPDYLPDHDEDLLSSLLEDCQEMGIDPVKIRRSQYSPVMASKESMVEAAYEAADIIERHGRTPVLFSRLAEEAGMGSYIPACSSTKGQTMMLHTGSSSKQVGGMSPDEMGGVLETKQVCGRCPLAMQCLAVSMTAPQSGRASKSERVLPGTSGEFPLVLDEYIMFGGFTPQERKIIFDMVCDILEEKDSWR